MANQEIILRKRPVIVRALHGKLTLADATGAFNVGDEIQGDITGAKATIDVIENPGGTPTLTFTYKKSAPNTYTAFDGSEAITNNTVTGAATGSSDLTVNASDVQDLKSINGYPRTTLRPKVRIVIGTGNFQFAVNSTIDVESPSYAPADVVELTIGDGEVLTFLADTGLSTFQLTF